MESTKEYQIHAKQVDPMYSFRNFVFVLLFLTLLSNRNLADWVQTSSYPITISLNSCASYDSYIYCVGGWTANLTGGNYSIVNVSYYAKMTGSGLSPWNETSSYPKNVTGEDCNAYSGYIYCIGGGIGLERPGNLSYYAPISQHGTGAWNKTTNYPTNFTFGSCNVFDSKIYCIGGYGAKKPVAYFANISQNGIGPWISTNPYPFYVIDNSCQINNSKLYCIGGISNGTLTNSIYYANISSQGISNWTYAGSYPIAVAGQSCVISDDKIYCIDGSEGINLTKYSYDTISIPNGYEANISNTGILGWTSFDSYPGPLNGQNCQVYKQTIYCVGGWTGIRVANLAFYNSLNTNNTVASTQTTIPQTTKTVPTIPTLPTTISSIKTTAGENKNEGVGIVIGVVLVVAGILLLANAMRKAKKADKKKR